MSDTHKDDSAEQADLEALITAIEALPVEEMTYEQDGSLVLAGYCMQCQGEWDAVQALVAKVKESTP